jgi:GntR family phosphonate transport system transcriptional regulator
MLKPSPEPVWRQVEAILFAEIRDGLYREAQRLPAEQELAIRFEVNRHTVRQALAAVGRAAGGLQAQMRRLVSRSGFIDYAIGARTRFSASLLLQNREPGHQIIEAAIPGEEDALHLHQTRLTPVLAVDGIDLDLEGMPITLHENRFAGDRVQFLSGE